MTHYVPGEISSIIYGRDIYDFGLDIEVQVYTDAINRQSALQSGEIFSPLLFLYKIFNWFIVNSKGVSYIFTGAVTIVGIDCCE